MLSAMTFLSGISVTYFTLYYVGFSLEACREAPTYGSALRWPRDNDGSAKNNTAEGDGKTEDGKPNEYCFFNFVNSGRVLYR